MFSANENIQLRQHKRRIVQAVEATLSEQVLDAGTNVMVMQVACTDPGCVPIETVIIVVFPASDVPLVPGLPESAGGSFKTKILKPMADVVTPDDVLDVLPPAFVGGLWTMERLAVQLRDAVLAQLQQTAGADKTLQQQLAAYVQASLAEYVQHDCVAPPVGQPYPEPTPATTTPDSTSAAAASTTLIPPKGNYVMRRPAHDEEDAPSSAAVVSATPAAVDAATTSTFTITSTNARPSRQSPSPQSSSQPASFDSISRRRQQAAATRNLLAGLAGAPPAHARGIRRPGCPCCDPDNPSNIVDQMMQL